ncbi:MAG: hypothetical protein CSA65_08950 [Proteobacteria bacterium]|nr:MAG: hypothetical protein CSA65_08950 [Pseudomonadota bacterium]
MTALSQNARDTDSVKAHLRERFAALLDDLVRDADGLTGRGLEESVWEVLTELGRELLSAMLALACWSAARADGVEKRAVRLRLDRDYWLTQTTTLGVVSVPLFAYRDEDGRVQSPAKKAVFPLHPKYRSSELCLEWESRLGGQLPFRQAQEGLTFFTHGATQLEDSTIARHTALIGAVLDRRLTYRSPEAIAELLRTRATRDTETGRPLLYLSTDAHALRRYVDDSFEAPWKMVNGIRMWCVDESTGQVVHLGGEYTWGDCREVADRFASLVDAYIPDGDASPQVVLLTNGMEWIRTWVMPQMPTKTVCILDFYHALEHIAAFAGERFGAGSKAAKAWTAWVRAALFGKRGYERTPQKSRRGHTKRRRARRRRRIVHRSANCHGAGEALARELIEKEVPRLVLKDDGPIPAIDLEMPVVRAR